MLVPNKTWIIPYETSIASTLNSGPSFDVAVVEVVAVAAAVPVGGGSLTEMVDDPDVAIASAATIVCTRFSSRQHDPADCGERDEGQERTAQTDVIRQDSEHHR